MLDRLNTDKVKNLQSARTFSTGPLNGYEDALHVVNSKTYTRTLPNNTSSISTIRQGSYDIVTI